jgi:NAD(P)H-nitrite reductase large subunit
MARIVIIGSSASGFACAQELSNPAQDGAAAHEIVLISKEARLPYRRDWLLPFLSGEKKASELSLCTEDFFASRGIEFLRGKDVSRIEPARNRLALKDNTRIPYDVLVIASGTRVVVPDVPGRTKEGVFAPYQFSDFEAVAKRLDIVHTACVIGEVEPCRQFAQVLVMKGKEVKLIAPEVPEGVVSCEQVEWIAGNPVAEVIGEGAELKALKLQSGKAIGTSLVAFVGPAAAASEFLKDSEISREQGYLKVDEQLRTNIRNIFACGAVRQGGPQTWEEAQADGRKAAACVKEALTARMAPEPGNPEGSQEACPQTS